MRDKYGSGEDKYCYPDTDVLVNLLNIHDAVELSEAEIEFTTERYRSYESNIEELQQLNFPHLKYLHFYLFQDIYSWAGKTREVDISKGTTRFCTFTRIEPEANKLFQTISNLEHASSHEEFIHQLADLFCELNLLHPFREGNGRALRFFFEEMVFILGYEIHWPQITEQDWIDANIAGVNLNLNPLLNIFTQAVARMR
ncbi:Fic/DOC family protein [Vibrio ziniensis]|uniref:protein adenylyltransferase n=1 Tax=Vibrio ziniensis TaxID=2711221 RepID=A0A6G7CHB1_9VIBR|nr:Fic family protein [Vibrio ziniensis]QIH41464.1 cell filamentation protein Fic [Vibrio ziniensis]